MCGYSDFTITRPEKKISVWIYLGYHGASLDVRKLIRVNQMTSVPSESVKMEWNNKGKFEGVREMKKFLREELDKEDLIEFVVEMIRNGNEE